MKLLKLVKSILELIQAVLTVDLSGIIRILDVNHAQSIDPILIVLSETVGNVP